MELEALERYLTELSRQGKLGGDEVGKVTSRLRGADRGLVDALGDASQARSKSVEEAEREYNDSFEGLRRLLSGARSS